VKPSRRELLGALGAGAALAGCGPGEWDAAPGRTADPNTDWAAPGTEDLTLFPNGAMGGDPTDSSVMLWTKYQGTGSLYLHYALFTDGAWVDAEPVPVTVAEAGIVHHDLTDLPADCPVAFAFVDDADAGSQVSVTRTAPAAGSMGVMRVLVTSCSKYKGAGTFPVMPLALARGPVDVIMWAGDTVYTYDRTINEYRQTWNRSFSTPEFREFFSQGGHIFTWDDHEVTNNFEGSTVAPDLFANGTQAFFEHTPRRRSADHPDRIWRSNRFGDTLEIFVLDSRGERDYAAGEYLSPEQLAWLEEGLKSSPCRWKCILNSVPIANMPPLFDAAEELIRDRWEGYPRQRQQLVELAATIPGVMFLSGDHHMPAVARVEPEGVGENLWDIMCGATGSDGNPIGAILLSQPDTYGHQFPWSEAPHTATLLEFDPNGFMKVVFMGEDDLDYFTGVFDDQGRLLEHTIVPVPR